MKKYNNLFNKSNSKIDEIINAYYEYNELVFVNDIINKLNEDSTYYDILLIFENNYSYFMDFIKDKDGSYEEYINFIYNPYLNISKSIPYLSTIDIENKLIEKYDLFDIEVNFSDKNKLKNDLEYIIRLEQVEKYDLNKFKLIFDIDKILNN